MTQFDVRRNPSPRSRDHTPYLLIVQSDLLSELDPVAVVPLRRADTMLKPILRLNPILVVEGITVVMMPNAMAGIPRRDLGPVVANLDAHRDTILRALDMLLSGV